MQPTDDIKTGNDANCQITIPLASDGNNSANDIGNGNVDSTTTFYICYWLVLPWCILFAIIIETS